MKYALTALGTALAASPAFAHGAGHLHPHGSEYTPFVLGALAVLAAGYLMTRR